jgi:hypothetical protein
MTDASKRDLHERLNELEGDESVDEYDLEELTPEEKHQLDKLFVSGGGDELLEELHQQETEP